MKKLLLVLGVSFFALFAEAQTEAETKAWQAFMTPGEMHKNLAASAGKWKAEMTMWMAPGSAPTKSTVEANNEMVMGGRYLQSNYRGQFMGMPFEGTSLTAYDNSKQAFRSIWIDNMGTGMMVSEGKWNPATKTIEMSGIQTDPMTGKDMKVREHLTFNADGSQFMQMWMEHEGKEFKAMEIRLTKG